MSTKTKFSASVAHVVDHFNVVINRGAEQGVSVGDTFLIFALGPELIDPETNESLGRLEVVRGRAVVRHVQEKLSTLESIEFEVTPGKRKIIKRESGNGLIAFGLGIGNREEIEEGPERRQRGLDAKKGDLAKLLISK